MAPKRLGLCDSSGDLTRREWLILTAVGSVGLGSGIATSLQGPIYPQEAEKKGATATEYGMVFGVFELVNFILCPIIGKYMNHLGARYLMISGIIVAGLSYILFGFLDQINSHFEFITLSFILRIMEAVGISASFTAAFTVVAMVFTERVSTMLAMTECCYAIGFTLGPTVGGYFYQIGGFSCPFFVFGSLLLVNSVFIFFTLPVIGDDNDKDKPQVKMSSVLKLRPVMLDLLSVCAIHISLGYYLATLEPHLRQFNLSPLNVGLIFGVEAGIYMVTTPLVGILCENRIHPKKMMMLGFFICIASFALVGPLPFVPIRSTLWMSYLGMGLHGLGMSCVMVPGFIDAIRSSIRYGLVDDITTYSLVTGMSTSAVALGAFIGPSVAGFLADHVGIRNGTLFVISIYVILLVVMTVFLCTEEIYLPKSVGFSPWKEDHTESTVESAPVPTEHASMRSPTEGVEYGTTVRQQHCEEVIRQH